jgi:hypothetical protein
MKRYVWIVAVLAVTVGASASENPFELDENFKAIEQEENSLLKELKAISERREALEDAEDDISIEEDNEDETATVEEGEQPVEPDMVEVKSKVEKPEKNNEDDSTVAEEKSVEIIRIDKIKEKQTGTDTARKAEEKVLALKAEQERTALKKLEEERMIRKRAQEAELKRLEVAKRKQEEAAKVMKEMKPKGKEAGAKAESGVDINISKEELEAEKKADEILQKAIEEVDKED